MKNEMKIVKTKLDVTYLFTCHFLVKILLLVKKNRISDSQ